MVNYLWGGWEKNVVGVDEFLEFCEAVAAEPIMAINFAADGNYNRREVVPFFGAN